MRDPNPLLPLNYCEEEFTVLKDGTLAIWTDGAHREIQGKPKTGWGVAFSADSNYNTWKRTNLSHNNLLAEMEAIEFAIIRAPISHHIILFTDSLSLIKIINGEKTQTLST